MIHMTADNPSTPPATQETQPGPADTARQGDTTDLRHLKRAVLTLEDRAKAAEMHGMVAYKALSVKGDESTFVPLDQFEAMWEGFERMAAELVLDPSFSDNLQSFDDWVASELKMGSSGDGSNPEEPRDHLWRVFSSEQIDSIGLALWALRHGRNFIIGDETGIGKGRILCGVARYFWVRGKRVCFFTERENLLSAFWKDLTDTESLSLIQRPVVYSSSAKVFDVSGKKILSTTAKQLLQIKQHGFEVDSNLVLTNYSQVSLAQHDFKLDLLTDFCADGVLICDESHAASGDSNTNAFMRSLKNRIPRVVFSSATYIKDQSQVAMYESCLPVSSPAHMNFLSWCLDDASETNAVRQAISLEMTRRLTFLRREHMPLSGGWEPAPCRAEHIRGLQDSFADLIAASFELIADMGQCSDLGFVMNQWVAAGGTIQRLARNLLLVMKIPELHSVYIRQILAEDEKVVLVVENTFMSMVRAVAATWGESQKFEQESEESDAFLMQRGSLVTHKNLPFNFASGLKITWAAVFNRILSASEADIGVEALGALEAVRFKTRYQALEDRMEMFSSIPLSPLDDLRERLARDGITMGEISGRTQRVITLSDGSQVLESFDPPPRTHITGAFNDGSMDAVVLTRAGASGLSLHASRDFKDQRRRNLLEVERTSRANDRLQFLGRVNRKNQAVPPRLWNVFTLLPSEQRIVASENFKMERLTAHTSGAKSRMTQAVLNLFDTRVAGQLQAYLQDNFHLSKRMGLFMSAFDVQTAQGSEALVDAFLKRSILLRTDEQESILALMMEAAACSHWCQDFDELETGPKTLTLDLRASLSPAPEESGFGFQFDQAVPIWDWRYRPGKVTPGVPYDPKAKARANITETTGFKADATTRPGKINTLVRLQPDVASLFPPSPSEASLVSAWREALALGGVSQDRLERHLAQGGRLDTLLSPHALQAQNKMDAALLPKGMDSFDHLWLGMVPLHLPAPAPSQGQVTQDDFVRSRESSDEKSWRVASVAAVAVELIRRAQARFYAGPSEEMIRGFMRRMIPGQLLSFRHRKKRVMGAILKITAPGHGGDGEIVSSPWCLGVEIVTVNPEHYLGVAGFTRDLETRFIRMSLYDLLMIQAQNQNSGASGISGMAGGIRFVDRAPGERLPLEKFLPKITHETTPAESPSSHRVTHHVLVGHPLLMLLFKHIYGMGDFFTLRTMRDVKDVSDGDGGVTEKSFRLMKVPNLPPQALAHLSRREPNFMSPDVFTLISRPQSVLPPGRADTVSKYGLSSSVDGACPEFHLQMQPMNPNTFWLSVRQDRLRRLDFSIKKALDRFDATQGTKTPESMGLASALPPAPDAGPLKAQGAQYTQYMISSGSLRGVLTHLQRQRVIWFEPLPQPAKPSNFNA